MDTNVLFNIEYGIYLLSANENSKDNGCIINTLIQVTQEPCKIAITVNKNNYTTGMIQRTKKFNVSILNNETKFETIKNFGYQSGKNNDKFLTCLDRNRSDNGILYLTKYANSYISAYVLQEIDLGTHIMFVSQVVDCKTLNTSETLTYDFYQKNIKPKPNKTSGWVCKICGYVYEGEKLPDGYICPICKHGAIDFQKV